MNEAPVSDIANKDLNRIVSGIYEKTIKHQTRSAKHKRYLNRGKSKPKPSPNKYSR